jgi:hypothetical protein
MELRGAFAVLDKNAAFQKALQCWDAHPQRLWQEAISFFNHNHTFLKKWRNDVGGHFHDEAAEFAIDNINTDAVGTMEIFRRGNGADVRMPFAFELVALALTKNRTSKQPENEFVEEAFTFLLDAIKHCINAVSAVAGPELFDKLK